MTGSGSFWLIFAKMANLAIEIELEVSSLLRSVLYTNLTGEFKKTSFEDKTRRKVAVFRLMFANIGQIH